MKIFTSFLLVLLLLVTTPAFGQQSPVSALSSPGGFAFTGTTTGGTINLIGSGVRFHHFQWWVTTAPAQCKFSIQISKNNSTWYALTNSANNINTTLLDCTTPGELPPIPEQVNYIRIIVPTWATTGTVTFNYRGYGADPGILAAASTTKPFSVTGPSATELAAPGTGRVFVTSIGFTIGVGTGTGQNVTFVRGTGTACATNRFNLAGPFSGGTQPAIFSAPVLPTPIALSGGGSSLWNTQTGEGVCVLTTGGQAVAGWLSYIQF